MAADTEISDCRLFLLLFFFTTKKIISKQIEELSQMI